VWFIHVECDFHTQSGSFTRIALDFFTQSVIFKRSVTRTNMITTLTTVITTRKRVISTRRVWCWDVWAWLWHSRKWLRHLYVNHTLRVEITLLCDVHTHTVMNTRMNVIFTRSVWFLHAECNFRVILTRINVITALKIVISTLRVWFLHAECNFHTQYEVETH
jgi:hypothetical protein